MPNPRTSQDRAEHHEHWTPRDLIERHMFCPLSEIQRSLDHHRVQVDASQVLMISIDQTVPLRTLTLLSHASTHEAKRIVAALRDPAPATRKSNRPHSLWTQVEDANLHDVLLAATQSVGYAPGFSQSFYDQLLAMHATQHWQVIAPPFTPDASLTVNCLILRRGGAASAADGRFAAKLTEQANATANAAVHRDSRVTQRVDRALRALARSDTESADGIAVLLSMAKDVSNSAAAAVLLLDRASEQEPALVQVYADANPGYRLRSDTLGLSSAAGADVTAVASFTRRRPQLLQAGAAWPGEFRSTWRWRGIDVDCEIALPIPAAPGVGSTPNAGVLVLCRPRGAELQYGDYDLALLRNVVLRIALLRASLMITEACAGVIDTATEVALADSARSSHKVGPAPVTIDETLDIAIEDQSLPLDLAATVPRAVPVIDFAARATGSHSATLRLLVPAPGSPTGEFVLRRAVAWPSWRLGEEAEDIDPNANTVNSWVARHGMPAHIPNVNDPRSFDALPGLNKILEIASRPTRSELCLPVIVDDRVIGTVNLESPVVNGYTMLTELATACASQISLAATAIRRRYLSEVLSIGSDVQSSAHELVGVRANLDRLDMANLDADTAQQIEDVSRIISVAIGSLSLTREPDDAECTVDPYAIVTQAAKAAHVRLRFRPSAPVTVRWGPGFSRRFYLAIYEILKNLDSYGRLDSSGVPIVQTREMMIGGRSYVHLTMSHGYRPATEPDPRVLYRAPVQKADRLHFGAYTAGAIVRSLGGDIFAIRIDESLELILVVSMPVDDPAIAERQS